jgi:hypothetical protein
VTVATYEGFIRPSFLPVLAACPAAAQMTFYVVERFGEPEEDEAMTVGTDIHACVLLALHPMVATGERPDVKAALAKFPGFSGWDKACVFRCVTFAIELIRKTRREFPDDDVQVLLEHHLDGTVIGIERGGSADLLIVVPFKLVRIVDWKAGFLDQGDAAEHDQLAGYGVMGAVTFKCRAVEVYLFQPRAEADARASGAKFAADDLRSTETWVRSVVEDAKADNPEAVAGLHCTKCRALARCPVAKEFIMRLKDALDQIAAADDAAAWGDLIDAAQVAKKFAEDGIEQAKGHLIAGGKAERWALKPGQINRKVDPKQAVALARDAGLLHILHEHISVGTSAIDALPAIAPAVTTSQQAPRLTPIKASSGAKP